MVTGFLNKLNIVFLADKVFRAAARGNYMEALEKIRKSGYSDHELSSTSRGVEILLIRGFLWREEYRKLDDSWLRTVIRAIDGNAFNIDEKYYLNRYAQKLYSLDNQGHGLQIFGDFNLGNVRSSLKRNFPLI